MLITNRNEHHDTIATERSQRLQAIADSLGRGYYKPGHISFELCAAGIPFKESIEQARAYAGALQDNTETDQAMGVVNLPIRDDWREIALHGVAALGRMYAI